MQTNHSPAFHYRLGLNQPIGSPTQKRITEMAEAIRRETDGEFQLEVFPESRLGPDPQMFADMRSGALEFFMAGATLGEVLRRPARCRCCLSHSGFWACSRRSTARSATGSAASWRNTGFMPSVIACRTGSII